jgi:hypothetical protein
VKVSKRVALGAVAVAGIAMAMPASAGTGTHGSGSADCVNSMGQKDGTVTWTPTTVWPPNHKMQTITISYTAPSDAPGDQSTIAIGMITDDQAASDGSDELNGSGQPTDQQGLDWSGTGNTASADEGTPATTTAQVRAERSGTDPNGRTYSIQVMCGEQDAGAAAVNPAEQGTATVTVTVPHDQGNN